VYGSDAPEGRAVGGSERAQLLARSERDVLDVLERTITEYGADRSRVFLTGHSMGGGGSWYLAHQHPHLWAAVAPSAGPFFIDNYDFERLRDMAIMIVQGSGDPPSLAADRQLAIDLLSRGFGVNYLETPSVNHGQTFGASLPSIFEFFEREQLRERPDVPLALPECGF
jgi:predicted peptidase